MNNDKKRRKKSKKIWFILAADILLVALVLFGFYKYQYDHGLDMNGSAYVVTNLGQEYKDPGVRSSLAHVSNHVNVDVPGYYSVEYTLRDKKAVRRVHVVDPEQLVVGLKGSAVQIVRQGDPYVESGAFAIDRKRGAIKSSTIRVSGRIDTDTPGEYTVKYTARSGDIKRVKERTVKVVSADDYKACESVPVMMYHWIYSQDDIPPALDGNWIEDTVLEEHLKYLEQNDYYYPSWRELSAWIDGKIALPEKSIILTFDDGKKAFYEHGIPLFEKYAIPVTSFLICWQKNDAENKIKKYASEYIDFESHTYAMHQPGYVPGHRGIIARMTKEEIESDLRAAAMMTGNNDAFAYPYGDNTPEAQEALRELGVPCSFTIEYGKVLQGMDKTILPRVRVRSDLSYEFWLQSIGAAQ